MPPSARPPEANGISPETAGGGEGMHPETRSRRAGPGERRRLARHRERHRAVPDPGKAAWSDRPGWAGPSGWRQALDRQRPHGRSPGASPSVRIRGEHASKRATVGFGLAERDSGFAS